MATYKVLQDIEAEDKLVGPLTLRQFIYACIAAINAYLSFLVTTKGAAFMLIVFLPVALVCGFFAWPWGQDQPTEVWALARIRFLVKPRRRIWDQSGTKDLVVVTAPRTEERPLTNGLNQDEVRSRLSALADTIDSRGWALKGTNINLTTSATEMGIDTSDRLVQASSLPQEVSDVDVNASDDMLDESANPVAQQFDDMINAAGAAQRRQLLAQIQQSNSILPAPLSMPALPVPPQPQQQQSSDYWFMQGQTPTINDSAQATVIDDSQPAITQPRSTTPFVPAATPTPEEEALVEKLRAENASASMTAAYGHMKTLKTPEQLRAEARAIPPTPPTKPPVTPGKQAAIINLANNNDLSVETIAKQAHEQVSDNNGEVVISLH
ncbi:MAG TPA: PrgI family protein [Verrucomicrobiae bacterium]|nr:PrgI family protein [Verrucomicrobiae bacterium]